MRQRHGARSAENFGSIFEDEQGWNALNLKGRAGARFRLSVQFGEHQSAGGRFGGFQKCWCKRHTGAAPGCPEIDNHGPGRLLNQEWERFRGEGGDSLVHWKRCFASTTFGVVTFQQDPI